jgi:hypothetical protein
MTALVMRGSTGWELLMGFGHHVDAMERPWRLILAGAFPLVR